MKTNCLSKPTKFPRGAHRKYKGSGSMVHGWYPHPCLRVEGSFEVAPPSHRYPHSYLNHFYTIKYAKMLFEARPDLYAELHGVDDFRKQVFTAKDKA